MPATCAIRANGTHLGDDGFPRARTRTLFGTGQPEADGNLHNVPANNGVDDMFRVVSSVQFSTACSNYYSASIGVRWDLDLDGTTETAGNTVTFSAAAINGPSDVQVAVQAQHPIDGRTANRTIAVTVNNVSPVIDSWSLVDRFGRRLGVDVPFALRGRPIRGLGTFSDAGTLDHQTASVAGAMASSRRRSPYSNDAFGGVEGHAEAPRPHCGRTAHHHLAHRRR